MRLGRVQITGFGGVAGTAAVDLSADVIILQAVNGLGKSTICDAVAWCLSGEHPRGADPRNLYSRSGETQVSLELIGKEDRSWSVRRIISNPGVDRSEKIVTAAVVEGGETALRGNAANDWILRSLLSATGSGETLNARVLVDSFYLQQESLRDFLVSRSDDQRFAALSRMVGAGSLDDFVRSFDSARKAWSRSLTESQRAADDLERRVESARRACEGLREEIRAAGLDELPGAAASWLGTVRALTNRALPEATLAVAVKAGVAALRELDSSQRRQAEAVRFALADFQAIQAPSPGTAREVTERELVEASTLVDLARKASADAARQVRDARRSVETERASREELASMATIALRHVSDCCPTCGQSVNAEELRARLAAMVDASGRTPEDDALASALNAAEAAERELAERADSFYRLKALRDEFVNQRNAQDAHQSRLEAKRRRLLEVLSSVTTSSEAIGDDMPVVFANRTLMHLDNRQGQVLELLIEGDVLESRVRASTAEAELVSLQQNAASLDAEYELLRTDLQEREATAGFADALMKALKRDSEEFLNGRLREIQPLLDQLYSAIEPHPTFRNLTLETRNWYGKNRLDAVARDPASDVAMTDPGKTLSTSQANALAVTIFLAFNLGLAPTTLESVVLDDPLQNLDDVHLLGLVDLLRRIAPYRQIVVTTHDRHFGSLLARKLRPLDTSRRAEVIEIVNWDRSGPNFRADQVNSDPSPMKLTTATL